MPSIGGTIIVRNAIKQDYCIVEAIDSLSPAVDEVLVGDCGSDDGTAEMLLGSLKRWSNVKLVCGIDWECINGRERLSKITTDLKNMLCTDWHFNLQADEILHEDSIHSILAAVRESREAYHVRRFNLWGSSKTMVRLDLPKGKPVSDVVCRLAKTRYDSFGDAESLNAPGARNRIDSISIFHMGFVRDKKKHVGKILNMQGHVFKMNPDPRVIKMQEEGRAFDPSEFFTPDQLEPAPELPKYIKEWAKERDAQ